MRSAAVAVQRGAPPAERIERLAAALEDPIRSVRIAAAREALALPAASMPPPLSGAMDKSMNEWRASLMSRADFPETHMAIGGAALVLRNPQAARGAFREAVRLDPQSVDAWNMIIRIHAALGDRDGARAALDEAIAANREAFVAARTLSAGAGTPDASLMVTVQDTGGSFGLTDIPKGRAWLAGLTALAKTAAQEWPNASVKAIDLERGSRDSATLAQVLADELLAGGGEAEVGLKADGQRLTLRSVAAEVQPGQAVIGAGGTHAASP